MGQKLQKKRRHKSKILFSFHSKCVSLILKMFLRCQKETSSFMDIFHKIHQKTILMEIITFSTCILFDYLPFSITKTEVCVVFFSFVCTFCFIFKIFTFSLKFRWTSYATWIGNDALLSNIITQTMHAYKS